MITKTKPLNDLQLEMLKLFSRDVPANDLIELKKIIANYFANKAMKEADNVWLEKGFTDEYIENLSNQHLRGIYL